MRPRNLGVVALNATLALAAMVASARAATGHEGRVTFGAVPVPGATVTATQGDRRLLTSTDEAGVYRLADLTDGVWTVRVEMSGFSTETREIVVAPGSPPALWMLTLHAFDEIAKTATPMSSSAAWKTADPAPPQNRAHSPNTANLPNTANPQNTANLPNAANPSNPLDPSDPFGSADGFLVNGSVNNGAASPFAQFAAFGNNRRGQRSLYNGGFGVLLGNSAWDARPFSFTEQPSAKPSYDDVQVVGTFGGPVRIPGRLRNGPTLFLGYQHASDHRATSQSALLPTWAERRGDFSQSQDAFGRPVRPIDPETGRPFADDVIPPSLLSQEAQALLQYYPAPNAEGGHGYNYQTPVLLTTHQDNVQVRATQALNGANQLYGNLSYQRTTTDAGDLFGFTDTTRVSTIDGAANWSHRLSLRMTLRLRYQFTRLSTDVTPYFSGRTNVSGQAGITGGDQQPENWGPPTLKFSSGLAGLSSAQYAANESDAHAASAEATWGVSRHALTLGGSVRPHLVDVFSQQDARGTFTFTGGATGSDLADFLLGAPHASSIASGNADKQLRATNADAYLSDDWRVTPTFTVNAGLRWEFESPFTELSDHLANLDVASDFSDASRVTPAEHTGSVTGRQYSRALVASDPIGLQPRVGIAWRPVPGSSLVVRAGYGLYRNTNVYESLALLMAQQPPFGKTLSVETSAAAPLTLADGFSALPSNTFSVDPDYRIALAQNWQVSAQRDLPASLTVIGTYAGTKGSRLMQEFLPNTVPPGAPDPCVSCPSGFAYLTSHGTSLRNAGQIQLRRRMRDGLTAMLQYTLSKATDNAAAFLRAGDGPQTTSESAYIAQDWRDLDADRGPSNFDQRHVLVAQVQYTTGMSVRGGALLDGAKGALLKGWTATAQVNAGSGLPLSPVYLTPVPGTGVTGTVRADLTGISPSRVPSGYYVNPVAYAPPETGHWGNAGRNSLRGPAQSQVDAAISRAFLMGDKVTLDWRVDATNVFNRVVYSTIGNLVGSPQFGLPTSANSMRTVQSSIRVRF